MVTSARAYLGLLALLSCERVIELLLSRRNARRAFARGGREHGRGHFPAMALLHAAFLCSCALEVILLRRAFPGIAGFIALGALAAAQALRYWAIASLGDRWNVRVIVVPGDEPVVSGPYRFVRHPNYLAVAVEMLAIPLVHGALFTAAVFSAANAALLRVRIRAEEEALGASWERAFTGRPRFIPGGGDA
jgi:methyltransferase